jgi:hypothetical protein
MVFWTSLCSACSLENCTNGNERFFSKRIPIIENAPKNYQQVVADKS